MNMQINLDEKKELSQRKIKEIKELCIPLKFLMIQKTKGKRLKSWEMSDKRTFKFVVIYKPVVMLRIKRFLQ